MDAAQFRKTLDEIDKNQAEVRKLISAQGNLAAELGKLWRETGFYPFVAGSCFTLALGVVIALLIRLFM